MTCYEYSLQSLISGCPIGKIQYLDIGAPQNMTCILELLTVFAERLILLSVENLEISH